MTEIFDQRYLLKQQYNTSTNLTARIQLHERFSTNPVDWQRWVFDQFEIAPHSRILELGTGSGQLWVHNLERIPSNWEITLSDFSSGMLEDARANLGDQATRFQFAVADAQALPFGDNAFDYVIANHMLYHVPDRQRAFAEIRRVLQPQGRFSAATNGDNHLREMKLLCEKTGIGIGGILSSIDGSPFSLQNGAQQMAPWFTQIEMRQLEGDLAVTEAEPLIDYIISSKAAEDIGASQLQALRAAIDEEIKDRGFVHISKETGLFIASN